ncbi:MAG: type II toxin-antitoxin system Phd/YefM family antitoxin [Deltaproteobacteria bacterium]|nr:type II toxin-antitoxin system Phd/YefM family antitoxin [Deltaproteobacteria bacterium]
MKKTNALQMRQSLGKVLRQLKATGEPILVEQGRVPAAVLISLEDFQKRFVDIQADQKRAELVERIKQARIKLPAGKSSLDIIHEIRAS